MNWFDDSDLHKEIGRKSFRGLSFTLSAQFLKFFVNLGGTAVLARVLTPGDFGLVAMLISVTGVAFVINDLGLSTAIVQRPKLTHSEVNCLFWITVAAGLVTALTVAWTGPLFAIFLKDTRLKAISPLLALTFLFSSLGSPHRALLRRHMCFGVLGAIELISGLGSYLIAIWLAFVGAGYWALVLQQVIMALFIALASWVFCSWRPGRPAWEPTAITLIGFGGNLTGSNLLNYACRNIDNILIGRFCGSVPLGLYSKAYQLLLLPIWQINTPMMAAITPALSRLQFDLPRFKQLFLKSVTGIALVGMPVVVFMFVRAEGLIRVALGPGWTEAVPIFRLLAPAAFIDTFNIAGGLLLTPLGRSGRQFRLSAISAVVIILAFSIGIYWGVAGVAISFSLVTCAMRAPALMYCCATTPIRFADLLEVLWRPAFCSIAAGSLLCLCFGEPKLDRALYITLFLGRDFLIFLGFFSLAWIVVPGGWSSIRAATTFLLTFGSQRPLHLGGSTPTERSSPDPKI